jgi:hypothetical protein
MDDHIPGNKGQRHVKELIYGSSVFKVCHVSRWIPTERHGAALTLLSSVRQAACTNLRRDAESPDSGFTCFILHTPQYSSQNKQRTLLYT